MADARNILAGKLRNYKLCKHCLTRHGSRQKADAPCFICRGLLDQQEEIINKVIAAAKEYEYDTFLIGAMMPTQIFEREDAMRARLKIRGKESAKSQLTRELGIALARATRKKADYLLPDLVINLIIDKENNVEVSAKSRPVVFEGRYTKKAQGLTQKQERCQTCEGKGCVACSMSGLSSFESVEGVIAQKLMSKTGGQTPKFSWLGSEDRSSLVLGKGRPFFAKIFDPRKRKLSKMRIRDKSVVALLYSMDKATVPPLRFTVKTRIMVRCDKTVEKQDMSKLRSLAGKEIRFDNRSKIAIKKISSATVKRIDNNTINLTIEADGGLMIKQFVGGKEFMTPNVSELLGTKCECISFDILDVHVNGRIT